MIELTISPERKCYYIFKDGNCYYLFKPNKINLCDTNTRFPDEVTILKYD